MRILITGATGQVGRALVAELAGAGEIIAADRAMLDLAAPEAIPATLDAIQPGIVLNCAAYTAVDKAEAEPALAFKVNAETVGALGAWAAKRDVPVVHFSTDYVFDGEGGAPYKEDDALNPLSVYGKSKAEGEALLLRSGAPCLVIRTAWVYAAEGKNFLNTIACLARGREELRVVDDQTGAPTSALQIAQFIAKIVGNQPARLASRLRETAPLVHFTASGSTSWHGFATAIVDGLRARGANLSVKSVQAIPTSEYPTAAKRPRDSRLSIERARDVFGFMPGSWQSALDFELDRLSFERTPAWK
jgi:dTDP-4-dehydrorhamnose reductase